MESPAPPGERQFEVRATKYVDLTFLKVLTLIPGLDLEDPVAVSAGATAGCRIAQPWWCQNCSPDPVPPMRDSCRLSMSVASGSSTSAM